MLLPKLYVNISNSGTTIDIYEKTNPYLINLNEGGWGNINPTASDITTSFIDVHQNDGSAILETIALKNNTVNVYSPTTNYPTPGEFQALSSVNWIHGDGVFKFVYTINVDLNIYKSDDTFELFVPTICNCREKLIIKLLDAQTGKDTEELKTFLDQIELFLAGIQASFTSGDFVAVNNLIETASLVCIKINDCLCGCK